MTTGEQIRRRRQELGWTIYLLAKRAKISKSYLSELERRNKSVGINIMLRISNALGLSVDALTNGKPGPATMPLPPALSRLAIHANLSYHHVACLQAFHAILRVYSTSQGQYTPESFDWQKFYEAVKEWL